MINEVIVNSKIRSLKLSNDENLISLKDVFVSLNIFEDIFSPFVTGKILLEDTNELISRFPIIGGENLEIIFNSKGDQKPKVHNFKIYKLDGDSLLHKAETNYNIITLYFCSEEMIINENTSISKKFYLDTASLLQTIVSEVLLSKKELSVGEISNKVDFISNFWKPTKVIKYLETNSKSNYRDFLFFENLDGFNFQSISDLMSKDASHNLYYRDSQESMSSVDIIKVSKVNSYFNEFELSKMGYFGNKVYHLEDDYYGFSYNMNDFISITDETISLGKVVQHREDLKNNNNIFLTFKDSEQLSYRDIILKGLSKYNMVIKVNGDSTKKVGNVFDIMIKENMKDVNKINKLFSGKWFCVSINHEILRSGKYDQNIKIVKNAFFDYDVNEKVNGRKNL